MGVRRRSLVIREVLGQVSSWGDWESVLKARQLGLDFLFCFCVWDFVGFFYNFVFTIQNVRTLFKGHTRLRPNQQLEAFSIQGKTLQLAL